MALPELLISSDAPYRPEGSQPQRPAAGSLQLLQSIELKQQRTGAACVPGLTVQVQLQRSEKQGQGTFSYMRRTLNPGLVSVPLTGKAAE